MKYLTGINEFFYFVLLFGFFHITINAQTSLSRYYLSDDVEKLINSDPNQALKISQYLLGKANTSNIDKARINFLVSKAYIAKGDYNSALSFLYEDKNYKDYLTNEDKINIEITKIGILRELTLYKQSVKILEKIENTLKTTSDSTLKLYIETSIFIEKAKFLQKEDKPLEGINLLKKHEPAAQTIFDDFKELELDFTLILGKLYLDRKDLSQALRQFEAVIEKLNQQNDENIYVKIDALYGLANVYFLEKDYTRAILLTKEATIYAERLGNTFLQLKINQLQSACYLGLNDMANYKLVNIKFFELTNEVENQEEEAVNVSYNVISEEYSNEYSNDKSKYTRIIYVFFGLLSIIILISIFLWQKILGHKKRLKEIINYIEITRNNILNSFNITDKKKHKHKKTGILKETEEQILNKLKQFEKSKRFLNKDISLAVLAGQLDSNTKYLSEIINTHYNVNFNTYINKLRVNYIIEKLKTDPNFINYKISYLAENCGFSSHSSFATVFKSITGISPVKFIELRNKEKENNLLE